MAPKFGLELGTAVSSDGVRVPKRDTQVLMKVLATVAAVMYQMGVASGHLVKWSIIIRL